MHTPATVEEALRGLFLFEAMSEAQRALVAPCARFVQLARGEHLYLEGDDAHAFYGVIEGAVKVYRTSPAGGEFIVHIQRAGDLVAEAALFDVRRYPASCAALEDALLLRIAGREFTDLLMRRPELSLAVMHAYSRRLRGFVSALEELARKDVKARLAAWLLRGASGGEAGALCPLDVPKRELASMLGTIPETLSRTLTSFKTRGWIDEVPAGFTLLRPDLLRACAGD